MPGNDQVDHLVTHPLHGVGLEVRGNVSVRVRVSDRVRVGC